jgi:transcriptional regulator with XRE-family HTH domain
MAGKREGCEVVVAHPDTVAAVAAVGARVRELRGARQMTLKEFAPLAQLSVHRLRQVEDGHEGGIFAYYAVARTLGVPIKRLMEDKPERWAAWLAEFKKRQKRQFRELMKEEAE